MSKKKLKNHKAPWKSRETALLRSSASLGRSARVTAVLLGRSVGAVKYKAMSLRIRFRSIDQPTGVQRKLAKLRQRFGMRATLESRAA